MDEMIGLNESFKRLTPQGIMDLVFGQTESQTNRMYILLDSVQRVRMFKSFRNRNGYWGIVNKLTDENLSDVISLLDNVQCNVFTKRHRNLKETFPRLDMHARKNIINSQDGLARLNFVKKLGNIGHYYILESLPKREAVAYASLWSPQQYDEFANSLYDDQLKKMS